MQADTGLLMAVDEYERLRAERPEVPVVRIDGDPDVVRELSEAVQAFRQMPNRAQRRAKNKAARTSRKRNR